MVKIKFKHSEIKLITLHVDEAIKVYAMHTRFEKRLIGAVLERLKTKLIKRLATRRDVYTVNFPLDENLAFVQAYQDTLMQSNNTWAQVILHQTYNSLHQSL